jgi:hypothetical protein
MAPLTRDHDTLSPTDRAAYRPLAQALRRLGPGRNGKPPTTETGIRWGHRGVPDGRGGRIYLRIERLPGRWVTTDAAVDEFIAALTAARLGRTAQPPDRAPTARGRSHAAAEAALDAIGIKG